MPPTSCRSLKTSKHFTLSKVNSWTQDVSLPYFPICPLLSLHHREDAQAPKRVSWAKSNTGSDILSKNGTLSSIATSPQPRDPHQQNFHYPYSPTSASDSSVINAYQLRPGEANTLQGLPGYNLGGTPSRKHKRPPSTNGGPPQILRSPVVAIPNRTEGAQPQMPPPLAASPQISSSTLTRMGAVAVMVPAQSQAGSLV